MLCTDYKGWSIPLTGQIRELIYSLERQRSIDGVSGLLCSQLVETILEDMLAAHMDAQGAAVALTLTANAAAEVGALVVKVDQAWHPHQAGQRALQQR